MSAPWPAVSWEKIRWEGDPELRRVLSRRQQREHSGPYDAAVVPDIAKQELRLESDVLALADGASREIALFDQEAGHLAAPFSAILLRTESSSSSQIENLTSYAKAIGLAELGESVSPNANLIVSNVRAMEAALDLANDISEDTVLKMHKALLEKSDPSIVGHYRNKQVWIGGSGAGPHRATFVPPHHRQVPEAMADLMAFANRTDVVSLAKIAVAHAQFETIHPFPDGNGRTGRALVQSMLRNTGLTENVSVPLSAGLLSDIRAYFAALGDYRAGDPNPIVRIFAEAAERSTINGRLLAGDVTAILARWERALADLRSDSAARRSLGVILGQPVLNVKTLTTALGTTPPTAYAAIDALLAAGVLVPTSKNRRNRTWNAPEVLAALDDFGARAVRSHS